MISREEMSATSPQGSGPGGRVRKESLAPPRRERGRGDDGLGFPGVDELGRTGMGLPNQSRRRAAILVGGPGIGSVGEKEADELPVSRLGRPHERGLAGLPGEVDQGAVGQEQAGGRDAVPARRQDQGSDPASGQGVGVGMVGQQEPEAHLLVGEDRHHQRGDGVGIAEVGVGALLKKVANGLGMAQIDGPHEGGIAELRPGVDVGPVAEGPVDGGEIPGRGGIDQGLVDPIVGTLDRRGRLRPVGPCLSPPPPYPPKVSSERGGRPKGKSQDQEGENGRTQRWKTG